MQHDAIVDQWGCSIFKLLHKFLCLHWLGLLAQQPCYLKAVIGRYNESSCTMVGLDTHKLMACGFNAVYTKDKH